MCSVFYTPPEEAADSAMAEDMFPIWLTLYASSVSSRWQ